MINLFLCPLSRAQVQLLHRLPAYIMDSSSHSQPATPPSNEPSRATGFWNGPLNFVAFPKAGDSERVAFPKAVPYTTQSIRPLNCVAVPKAGEQWQNCPHCKVFRCLCVWGINQWEYLLNLYEYSYTSHCMCGMHIYLHVCVLNTHRYEYLY